jgi:23S rRNA pseudouridine955/2504/2580 synthase
VPGAQVTASEHRLRIDRFLKRRLSEVGRGRILEWVRAGSVSVNGRPLSAAEYFVKQGDRVEWPAEPILRPGAGAPRGGPAADAGGARARPELALLPGGSAWESEWPPAVLHEDRDLLVINKAAGLPTNPSPAAGSLNVLSLLERGAGRLHLVHRLDRDTSGALVLARNARARDRLLQAFRARRVDKLYDAVVAGSLRAASGSLRMRLLPHPRRSTRRVETVSRGLIPKTRRKVWSCSKIPGGCVRTDDYFPIPDDPSAEGEKVANRRWVSAWESK